LSSTKYGTRKSSSSCCFAIHTLRDLRLNGLAKMKRAVAPLSFPATARDGQSSRFSPGFFN
jgi:hypothetical protein